MTTNQEGVHAAVRAVTGTSRSYNEDWHALFDDEGIAAGTFNERMLAWINATLGTSYSNLNEGMQAFAVDQGFTNWASMNTFVAGSDASSFLSDYGPYGMVLNFQDDASIAIKDETATLDFRSDGQVSGGAFVGPGAKLTYTAPSLKLTEQADGFLAFQAHNLAGYSEDFTRAGYWTNLNSVTSTANGATDYAGNLTATSFTGNGVANQPGIVNETVTHLVGATYSFSFDWKNVSSDSWIKFTAPGGSQAWFDTVNLVVGTMGSAWVSVVGTPIGNGYVRITATYVPTSTLYLYAQVVNSNNSVVTTNKSGVFYLCRGQIRRTPSASDYIKTTTAAAYDLPYVYSSGVRTGIMVEPAATNLALRSNDFTNASWTKSNMTAALTATGPDGVANSASTLTATAGNATALQAITSASSSRVTSVYVKRRTGSGNIDLTQDNGTTWTTQTVTSSWTRVALAAVTSTDPTVGIRIVTSGDEIDVWCFQHETGTDATSPIITYGSTVLRAADNISIATSLFPHGASEGTLYASVLRNGVTALGTICALHDGTSSERIQITANSGTVVQFDIVDGGVAQAALQRTPADAMKAAAAYALNDAALSVNASAVVTDASVTLPTVNSLRVGSDRSASFQLNGTIKALMYVPRRMSNAELQAVTA